MGGATSVSVVRWCHLSGWGHLSECSEVVSPKWVGLGGVTCVNGKQCHSSLCG